jgi:hypothetical protein
MNNVIIYLFINKQLVAILDVYHPMTCKFHTFKKNKMAYRSPQIIYVVLYTSILVQTPNRHNQFMEITYIFHMLI